ncbi:radical SAM protein [Coprothermobacter proteolyticus]|uniref:radical SAM protein n=1 Tax=Coprothermobacter proteolyticus TaxID=35786 RepID=UPI000D320392|nr:radical SAM protein [Coprothermobacter proteolyticus]
MTIFGPIPSRRLGASLGVNNIPYKICSYNCVYCQVGRTLHMQMKRTLYSNPSEVFDEVKKKVERIRETQQNVDYISIVPDGEPTLDSSLGELIERLKELGLPVAVITNSSLTWDKSVQEDLKKADWVSVKIDAISPNTWKQINRPHASLSLDEILQGMQEFAGSYTGTLCTETMLVKELNDNPEELTAIANFIKSRIRPYKAYIGVPTRPPAEPWVSRPEPESITAAYAIFTKEGLNAETLTGYESSGFVVTDNPVEEILEITAVHPMRSDAVKDVLNRFGVGEDVLQQLVKEGRIRKVHYEGWDYYIRVMR